MFITAYLIFIFNKKKRKLNFTSDSGDNSSSQNTSGSYVSRVGGCLVLSEYNLIISHNKSVIDIIGLGQDDKIDPCWHFVVDEVNASYFRSCGVEPISSVPSSWKVMHHSVEIFLSRVVKERKITFDYKIIFY